jgi:hypothetical protein
MWPGIADAVDVSNSAIKTDVVVKVQYLHPSSKRFI